MRIVKYGKKPKTSPLFSFVAGRITQDLHT